MATSTARRRSRRRGTRELVEAGLAAGLLGGVVMAIVLMIATAVRGMGALGIFRLIAEAFYGSHAIGGVGPIWLGLFVHLVFSLFFGLGFAFLASHVPPPKAQLLGVIYGVIIWLLAINFGLPTLNPLMQEQASMMPFAIFLGHALFGLGASLAPLFGRVFFHLPPRHSHA